MEAAGHVKRRGWIRDAGDFVVKAGDLDVLGCFVAEVDRCRVPAFLQVEVCALGGGAIEPERHDVARVFAGGIQRFEGETLETNFFDLEFTEVGNHRFAGAGDREFAGARTDFHAEF